MSQNLLFSRQFSGGFAAEPTEALNLSFGRGRFLRAIRALKRTRASFTPVRNDFLQVIWTIQNPQFVACRVIPHWDGENLLFALTVNFSEPPVQEPLSLTNFQSVPPATEDGCAP